MIRTDRRMRGCTAALLCILAFIWGNSLMPAEISQAFSDGVKKMLMGLATGKPTLGSGSGLLRKVAHFTEFAALGFCLGWRCGMLKKPPYLPMLLGIAAACIDESIQLFVPNRGPGIWDVLLDSCGVAAGMALVHLGHTYCKKKHNERYLEDT